MKKLNFLLSILFFFSITFTSFPWSKKNLKIIYLMGYACGYETRTVYEKIPKEKRKPYGIFLQEQLDVVEKLEDRVLLSKKNFLRGFMQGIIDRETNQKPLMKKRLRLYLILRLRNLIKRLIRYRNSNTEA